MNRVYGRTALTDHDLEMVARGFGYSGWTSLSAVLNGIPLKRAKGTAPAAREVA